MARIAINGLGRIGKLILRAFEADGAPGEVVLLNDAVGTAADHAHLLEFDTVHGRWDAEITSDDDSITIDGTRLPVLNQTRIADLPLDGVDVVIDCTGVFKSEAKITPYFEAGVKKVVVSAPVKDGDAANIVYGVNHDIYDAGKHRIVTAASCTTNCLAPLVKPLHEAIGVKHGIMTTIHAYTNDQVLTDVYHKDLRRARSATMSQIPTSTGAAKAVGLVLPELNGKLDGFSMRVPTINVSAVDLTFVAERATSIDEINEILKAASEGELKGVLAYNDEPLVSIDFNHDPASSTYDASLTKVIDGTMVKVISWYDNEWGFSNRMLDTTVALVNAK